MAKAKKEVLIPFDKDGSIPHYLEYDGKRWDVATSTFQTVDMKPAEPFHAVLQLDRMDSGRSAHNAIWRNVLTDARYYMTQAEFNRVIKDAEWSGPLLIDGLWKPVKKGANYLIQYVKPEDS